MLVTLFGFVECLLFFEQLLLKVLVVLFIKKKDVFEIVDFLFVFFHEPFFPVLNEIRDSVSPVGLLVFHSIDFSLQLILPVFFLLNLA